MRIFGAHPGAEPRFIVSDTVVLRIVPHYKYLRSRFSVDGSPRGDVDLRIASASAAYGPRSRKVFGQPRFPVKVRCCLDASLIFSRLLYGVQTWSKITLASCRRLNSMYMRVYREIAGCPRYGPNSTLTDLAVRKLL